MEQEIDMGRHTPRARGGNSGQERVTIQQDQEVTDGLRELARLIANGDIVIDMTVIAAGARASFSDVMRHANARFLVEMARVHGLGDNDKIATALDKLSGARGL